MRAFMEQTCGLSECALWYVLKFIMIISHELNNFIYLCCPCCTSLLLHQQQCDQKRLFDTLLLSVLNKIYFFTHSFNSRKQLGFYSNSFSTRDGVFDRNGCSHTLDHFANADWKKGFRFGCWGRFCAFVALSDWRDDLLRQQPSTGRLSHYWRS